MGVPVVCLLGEQLLARSAASLITTAGYSSLVGRNPDEYVSLATALAGDRESLAKTRREMRQKVNQSRLLERVAIPVTSNDFIGQCGANGVR